MFFLASDLVLTVFSEDLENEIIVLKAKGGCDISELEGKVPEDAARYHLFRFKHTHEGDYLESSGRIMRM
jgi:twinfilin-like protein